MSDVLVVGVDGTIGSALFNYLNTMNISAWGSSHRPVNQRANIFYLNLLDDPKQWSIPKISFGTAFLCAGVCRMALCEDDPELTRKINVIGMTRLVDYLVKMGVFVVYLSTNQVFSGAESYVHEHTNYQPLNKYGQQKADVETYIKTACQAYAIVRLTKVFEPKMQLLLGWVDKLVSGNTIEAFHDMVLAPVTLKVVIELLFIIGIKKRVGIFQISGAKDISYFELAKSLADILNCSNALILPVSAKERGMKINFLPRFTTMDCSSIMSLTSGEPPDYLDVLTETLGIK